ncbi:Hypothetical predicted protein [Lecanosticta acicola]|uniref:Uncharacterized protein n=1 Tax=Lecanosticta acicola TaxID=111012 RepID=A0AAI8W1Y0_9PEZI|nr:Hypothetical predicted protein [Lecanosticta acicola]
MTTHEYTVASASQLTGAKSPPSSPDDDAASIEGFQAMDKANKDKSKLQRRSAVRRSVRFTPSTVNTEEEQGDGFTSSRSASSSSGSSPAPVTSETAPTPTKGKDDSLEFLMPARYSPQPNCSANRDPSPAFSSSGSGKSHVSVPERVKEYEGYLTTPKKHERRIPTTKADLAVDTDVSHKRNSSTASSSSRRKKKGDIYFTPTEVTQSQIFLSSPKPSPTMPDEQTVTSQDKEKGGEVKTPRASLSRPPSAIYVGHGPVDAPTSRAPRRTTDEKLTISPLQLDQLIAALVKSSTVQKHVRKHWWDAEDIPDDQTVVSYTSITTPTLTSASTLYSRPNENFVNEGSFPETQPDIEARDFARIDTSCYENKKLPLPPAAATVPFGGVALTDPKVHGSPIRYISRTYRVGANVVSIGSCSFVNVPYGSDVECALRIEPPSNINKNCKVMLQCVNQVVDRKTGKKTYLLVADVDVTEIFTKAALAELAQLTETPREQIELVASPTSSSAGGIPPPLQSPDIDWTALADELQATAHLADTLDNALRALADLQRETCSMQTLTLLSELDRIRDGHEDFVILKATAHHENGVPSNVRLPWVSRRLYQDWYVKDGAPGASEAARGFQREIVGLVARRAMMTGGGGGEGFHAGVMWEETRLGVRCVPLLSESAEGKADVWVVFIQGESLLV